MGTPVEQTILINRTNQEIDGGPLRRRMRRYTSSSRSVCVANGRLRHTGEDPFRYAPPCVVSRV